MIGCVYIPDFPVAVERFRSPNLYDKPLVVTHISRGRPRVYAASSEAKACGVESGMSLQQARLLCEACQVVSASLPRYQRFLDDMVYELGQFATHLEPVRMKGTQPHGLIYINLGTLRHEDAHFIAARLTEHLTETWGFPVRFGGAKSKFTAMVAAVKSAKTRQMINIINPDDETSYLAPLPLEWLPMSRKLRQSLQMVGVMTLGTFASLPAGAVLDRYGKWGKLMQQLAQGNDTRRVTPIKLAGREQLSHYFEPPVSDRAILENVWREMTETFGERLKNADVGCKSICLILITQDRQQNEKSIRLSQPVTHAERLAWLGRYLLKDIQVEDAVTQLDALLLELIPTTPKQLSLFPEDQSDEALEEVIIDLGARYGIAAFGQISPMQPAAASPELRYEVAPILHHKTAGA